MVSSGIDDFEPREMSAVKPSIAGQKGVRVQPGMGPNEKIRDDPLSASAGAPTALPPQPPGNGCRLRRDRVELNSKKAHGFTEGFVGGEMRPDFGPHHLTGRQGPGIIG